tara:strand:+ start:191 stop:595 length:405 start_codon:yes stop_codon:yes gene_type:complete
MRIAEILQNKTYLLTSITLLTSIVALGPFFVAELTIEILAYEILHIADITFGIFLTILSIFAYYTTRNTNLVFTGLAFATFTILSIFLLIEDLSPNTLHDNKTVFVDVLLTIMIGFFAITVFSNQKFPNRRKYN